MTGTVLYIDDVQDNILLVQRMLRHARPDLQVRSASTGADGISAAIGTRPDLILLDNRLPGTSGSQVLRQLASSPATAAIPVVILSGDSSQVTVRELLAAGAADFIGKPFDLGQLLAVIQRHLP